MNILIFEYITGGGLAGEVLPASLLKEGEVMLNAAADDFAEITDVQVSVLCDARLQGGLYGSNEHIVSAEDGFEKVIEELAHTIDALLIIAPESNNILTTLCDKYTNREFVLLNSTPESIALSTDKFKTYEYFQKLNIAQIPTRRASEGKPFKSTQIIIKPRNGVGCEDVQLLPSEMNVAEILNDETIDDFIVQPYIEGVSGSLSLMCWEGKCLLLSANVQHIEKSGFDLRLKGCEINALDRDAFISFSNKLVSYMPGLRGYIGVDVLITDDEILLVEINPRLTTSYSGLKSALGINPAQYILHIFAQQQLPEFTPFKDEVVSVEIGEQCAA